MRTKPEIASDLAKAEAALKALRTRAKRLGTAIKKRERRIAALRRAFEKAPEVPPAPPPEAVAAAFERTLVLEAKRTEDARILAACRKWGRVFARVHGHRLLVRLAGSRGACRSTGRNVAHVHTSPSWWTESGARRFGKIAGAIAHRRGDVCVNPGWVRQYSDRAIRDLMAHEVAHLGTSSRSHLDHGREFDEIVRNLKTAAGVEPMGSATEDEPVDDVAGHEEGSS